MYKLVIDFDSRGQERLLRDLLDCAISEIGAWVGWRKFCFRARLQAIRRKHSTAQRANPTLEELLRGIQ